MERERVVAGVATFRRFLGRVSADGVDEAMGGAIRVFFGLGAAAASFPLPLFLGEGRSTTSWSRSDNSEWVKTDQPEVEGRRRRRILS